MIAFCASTTGGHVYPAIAVAQELGEPCFFLTGPEKVGSGILKRYGFEVVEIAVNLRRPLTLLVAFFRSLWILKMRRVTVLVASGGYVTVPVVPAAWILGIPVLLMEQNVVAGRANRLLQIFAKRIYLSFSESQRYFRGKSVVVGNPVRKTFSVDEGAEWLRGQGLLKGKTILIFGGSQGAQFLNQWAESHYVEFIQKKMTVLHLVGERYFRTHFGDVKGAVIAKREERAAVIAMPYFEQMDHLYALADLVLSRAGATTIAELIYFHKRAILVPYPSAKDDHQTANARSFEALGLGKLVPEDLLEMSDIETLLGQVDGNPQVHPHSFAREKIAAEIKVLRAPRVRDAKGDAW